MNVLSKLDYRSEVVPTLHWANFGHQLGDPLRKSHICGETARGHSSFAERDKQYKELATNRHIRLGQVIFRATVIERCSNHCDDLRKIRGSYVWWQARMSKHQPLENMVSLTIN